MHPRLNPKVALVQPPPVPEQGRRRRPEEGFQCGSALPPPAGAHASTRRPPRRRSALPYQGDHMDRARNGRDLHERADFVATGLAAVVTAMSYLLFVVAGGGSNDPGGTPAGAVTAWQVILAFGLMSAGLLLTMYGMRAPGARPPVLVRAAALLHAGGPERLVPVAILLVLSFLEAWFDFL